MNDLEYDVENLEKYLSHWTLSFQIYSHLTAHRVMSNRVVLRTHPFMLKIQPFRCEYFHNTSLLQLVYSSLRTQTPPTFISRDIIGKLQPTASPSRSAGECEPMTKWFA